MSRVFKINLLKGFLYPLTSLRRMIAAWLILPLSLLVLVPPILLGLGVFGTVRMTMGQGAGFSLLVAAVCILVGAVPFTFLAGYMLRCRKTVIEGLPHLPPWDGWRKLLADGGEMDTIALLIGLPTLTLFGAGLLSVAAAVTNLGIQRSWGALLIALVGSGTGLLFLLGAVILWLLVMLFSPISTLRLALGHTAVKSLSPLGMLRDIKKGWFDYLLCCAIVWSISVAFSAAQAAFWPLVLVAFPMQVYLQLVWAHLLGQFARIYLLPESATAGK